MKPFLTALILLLPGYAAADDISDALQAAQDAYAEGDIQYALDELDFARQQLLSLKTEALDAYLPAAPDGWTREDDEDVAAGLAMMGGGVGASATYTSGDGDSYAITLMADNPMVAGMSAMIANAAVMGMQVERIGRQRFARDDGQIIGLVGNRVLVQAEGENTDAMLQALGTIDYTALANFGQ